MSFYRAKLQTALRVYANETAIVETEIELPDFYAPRVGDWLDHPYLDGECPIALVGYDARAGRLVISLGSGAQDPTVTLEEWFQHHPHWEIAKKPSLSVFKLTSDGNIEKVAGNDIEEPEPPPLTEEPGEPRDES